MSALTTIVSLHSLEVNQSFLSCHLVPSSEIVDLNLDSDFELYQDSNLELNQQFVSQVGGTKD